MSCAIVDCATDDTSSTIINFMRSLMVREMGFERYCYQSVVSVFFCVLNRSIATTLSYSNGGSISVVGIYPI